jgi:integrase
MKGNIQKRKNHYGTSYRVRVESEPDPSTGKRRQWTIGTYKTRKDAEAAVAKAVADAENGTAVDPSKLTIRQYMKTWLASHEPDLRPSAYAGYETNVRRHIIPKLGNLRLQQLTTLHVQDFYTKLRTEGRTDGRGGLAAQTVKNIARILGQALQDATDSKLVARNVAATVRPPKVKRIEMKTWDDDQIQRFIDVARDDYYGPPLIVELLTGMRRGEVLGVRWQDVDLDRGTIKVQQALVDVHGHLHAEPPKTQSGRRTIDLLRISIDMLKEHKARQMERRASIVQAQPKYGNLVFTTREGKPLMPRNLRRRFLELTERAKLPRIRMHDMRHSHASEMLAATQDIQAVAARLGHASPGFTLNVYGHLLEGQQRRAVDRLEATMSERQAKRDAAAAQ